MIRPEDIEALSQRIGEMLPAGMKEGGETFRRNLRATVSSQLGKLDLVTREEFEVQRAVLQRSREKLERLQAQVDALEAELARRSGSG
jgi:BMFP domain-containing protein YqiC